MSNRGRKPTPTPLKLLKATRADRINTAEPIAPPALPDCPSHLDAIARTEWERIVPILSRMRVLSELDGTALALYCQSYSRWVLAEQDIAKNGLTVNTQKGGPKTNPAVAISAAAVAAMHRLLTEFGATPSSRTKIKATVEQGPKDQLGAFLNKRSAR